MDSNWIEATERRPCDICGHPGWCSRSVDGKVIACRRMPGGIEKIEKSGGICWLYFPDDSEPIPPGEISPPARSDSQRAEPAVLHKIYSFVFDNRILFREHHENLINRGLTDDEIKKRGYKSMALRGRSELAGKCYELYGNDIFHVPGFCIEESTHGKKYPTIKGSPGLWIPIRNFEGLIVGIKIRRDKIEEGKPKYQYLTSNGKNAGTGQISLLHFPLFDGTRRRVRITEGELKADIATALSGIFTISIPGVNSWMLALDFIRNNQDISEVIVSFDNDRFTNRNVAYHLKSFYQELKKFEVNVA